MPFTLCYRRGSFLQTEKCVSLADALAGARARHSSGEGSDFSIVRNGMPVLNDSDIRMLLKEQDPI